MRGYEGAVEVITQIYPSLIKGSSVLIRGDNQGAIAALNHLRSPVPEIHARLENLFDLCLRFDFDLVARWIPRDQLSVVDELSRRPDASDWGLTKSVFSQVCKWSRVHPSVDLFASDVNHQTRKFVSQFYTPGCSAVHAFKLPWNQIVQPSKVAWVFPPIRLVNNVISLIKKFRIGALLCMPVQEGSNELIQIQSIGAQISGPFMVPRSYESCIASSRVPSGTLNSSFLNLGIFLIQWH
jgi:hypothetical protein